MIRPRFVLPSLTELLVILVLALTAALLWQRLGLQEARSELTATKVALESERLTTARLARAAAVSKAVSTHRATQQEATNAKSLAAARKVQSALDQNRPWADTRVPDAVFDGLFNDGLQGP